MKSMFREEDPRDKLIARPCPNFAFQVLYSKVEEEVKEDEEKSETTKPKKKEKQKPWMEREHRIRDWLLDTKREGLPTIIIFYTESVAGVHEEAIKLKAAEADQTYDGRVNILFLVTMKA